MTRATESSELIRSRFGRPLEMIYGALGCDKRWRIGAVLIDLIRRFEGGYMRSATARAILSKYHQVNIGAYSYGPCFRPDLFPPDVNVGKYTSIAPNVRVVNENHPITSVSTHPAFYHEGAARNPLVIGNDVWIGLNAIILPGCRSIGDGAVIGAGSVVTKNVPAYAVVAGVPARILGERFEAEIVQMLLATCWWDLPFEKVREFANEPIREFCAAAMQYAFETTESRTLAEH
jgi:virginiamycin A acetyltransferase